MLSNSEVTELSSVKLNITRIAALFATRIRVQRGALKDWEVAKLIKEAGIIG